VFGDGHVPGHRATGRALVGGGRDNRHVTHRGERVVERADAGAVDAVVVREENLGGLRHHSLLGTPTG